MIELRGPYHYRWDNSLAPALTVSSGEVIRVECREATDGQFTPEATGDHMRTVDQSRVHSLAGPIFVEDAQPGDVLAVELLEFEHHGWAWTSIEPRFGVLHEEFGDDEYAVQIWHVDERERAVMKPGVSIPVKPFCGVIGVAPREPGVHPTIPPRDVGGNMDCRQLSAGATVYFPIQVPGALLSLGDGHLAQGDGEVCGTALEAPLTVTLRVAVQQGESLERVRFETRGPAAEDDGDSGYYATTATGPDLVELVRQSVSDMVRLLVDRHDLTRVEAYMLCSGAAGLKVAVAPLGPGHVGMVTYHLPRSVFEDDEAEA